MCEILINIHSVEKDSQNYRFIFKRYKQIMNRVKTSKEGISSDVTEHFILTKSSGILVLDFFVDLAALFYVDRYFR